jgi:hypothetical protein
MQAMELLVPEVTNLKDFTALMVEIEGFLKTEAGSTAAASPSELLAKWLRGEKAEAPPLGRVQ